MLSSSKSVNKVSTLTIQWNVNLYSLALGVNDDNMGSVVGDAGFYESGTEVTLTATPNEGYHFVKWSDGNTENPRTIVVVEDVELRAEFELDGTPVDNDNVDESSVMIYVQNGMLYIEGVEIDYNVFDASGRLVYSGRDAQLHLPRGVYMIAVGSKIQKVVL